MARKTVLLHQPLDPVLCATSQTGYDDAPVRSELQRMYAHPNLVLTDQHQISIGWRILVDAHFGSGLLSYIAQGVYCVRRRI